MIKLNPKLSQKFSYTILFLATVLTVIPVVMIIFIIIKNGVSAITWEFLMSMPKDGMRGGGILPAILGTLLIVTCAIAITLPIGVFAAIYLNEYAKNNLLTRIIKLAIVNLAGVPSVVYGLFGLGIFVMFLKLGVSIIAGALTLSIMELPVIITTSRNALNSVPYYFRDASLSLGVSRWQTIRYIVLPNAISGILTGAILSISRISGETAPILFTATAFSVPHLPRSVLDQVMTLPYHLYIISTQIPNMPENVIFGTALVLLLMVLTMSFIAIVARIYLRKRRKW
ncbi:MAG: phosphate ABC transporter permease PstA [Candidatus Endomicrobiellum trichonymphae]|uniref:Phosphate transport system permease protein PstA n=1 Tax=Endomicrobium trichonymphae TaxID=1408204 RepID=B1H045_ENDTX|nr:phosphate ABC transporter permease PstA [Candidatus Endomicrobium trichonymphae]BAG13877.1 ABC-type phosphate transporter permease component [Candidatus Endomicrobium trichonymphae]BAV59045.1 ABC-type phosphate transporter permease component [Candidatus Endomicrobium trichonymphae]GMO54757.1 MAG: phosphate ABC transporter permease PstA [Candidatus Endomicrobium trichonymphae]